MKSSLDSKLQIDSTCSFRIQAKNRDILNLTNFSRLLMACDVVCGIALFDYLVALGSPSGPSGSRPPGPLSPRQTD